MTMTPTKRRIPDTGFRELLDAAPDAMVVVDPQGDVIALNLEAERLFGWSEPEFLGHSLNRIIPPRFQQISAGRGRDEGVPVSLLARRRDGSEFPVELNRAPLGPGKNTQVLVTIRDLTKWRRAQENLFREKEQAFVTLSSIADGVVTTDVNGIITYLNPTAERLSGWRTSEALGQPLSTVIPLISDATRQPIESIPARCLQEGRAVDLADGVVLLRRDGTEVPIGDSAAPLRDRNGATIGVVVVFHDVTEKRRAARKLSHEATHDALTGLVSRKEFERRLARVLLDVAAGSGEYALGYLDLDRFKIVNDIGGHESGDALLHEIGSLLGSLLRGRDTVGRLGGDEFGVLLECTLPKAEEIARKIQRAITDLRFVREGRSFSVGVSIGIVPITPTSGRTADVLRAADDACYEAKEEGGNRIHVARPGAVVPRAQEQMESRRMARLTRAVEEGQFQLYAQRIVPLVPQPTARPRVEILLRLPDEKGGVETADAFLPQAERYRLAPAIDRWVVRQTVTMLGQWHREHEECELPLCSINLSASSLEDAELVTTVRDSLAEHRLPPEAICFEIAEAAAFGNFAELVRLIAEIRATGCGVGLDDFGNGLTSFAHLKALSVDFVKIGGHYVRGVVEDPVYGTLVSTVNEIGRIMGITTIAEEVESDKILEKLRSLGVGYAQGHAVGSPAPLADEHGEVSIPCVRRSA